MKVFRNTTTVHLVFHSWTVGEISFEPRQTGRESEVTTPAGLTTSLIDYSFDKSINSAAGRVRFTLKGLIEGCRFRPAGEANRPAKNGDPWTDVLNQGDWWGLSIEKNGQVVGLSFGVIDTISVNVTAPKRTTITVLGRDMGFGLEDIPVYFNPHDPAADNAIGINMLQIIGDQAGNATDLVRNMILGMFGRRSVASVFGSHIRIPPSVERAMPGSKPLNFVQSEGSRGVARPSHYIDLLDVDDYMQAVQGSVVIPQATLEVEQTSQSVWNYVSMWRNPPLNELYVDVDPRVDSAGSGKAHVIMRERPYVNAIEGQSSPWFSLATAYVDASTVSSVDLTKGQFRTNHVLLLGDLTGIFGNDSYALYPPAANLTSIERYGLRRLAESTNYFEDLGAAAGGAQLAQWRSLLVSWNALNHEYFAGRVTIREARPDIRIGMKVVITNGPLGKYLGFPDGNLPPGRVNRTNAPANAQTFYVEEVSYRGSSGQNPYHETTLTLSRGFLEGNRAARVTAETQFFQSQSSAGLLPGRSAYTEPASNTSPAGTLPASTPAVELSEEVSHDGDI